jgi:hypothetical protein
MMVPEIAAPSTELVCMKLLLRVKARRIRERLMLVNAEGPSIDVVSSNFIEQAVPVALRAGSLEWEVCKMQAIGADSAASKQVIRVNWVLLDFFQQLIIRCAKTAITKLPIAAQALVEDRAGRHDRSAAWAADNRQGLNLDLNNVAAGK